MELKIVEFSTAKLLKEAGFNVNTVTLAYINYYSDSFKGERKYVQTIYSRGVYYGNNPIYLAPTQALVQQWLRETYDIHVNVSTRIHKKLNNTLHYSFEISTADNNYDGYSDNLDEWIGIGNSKSANKHYRVFNTYEQALEAGILEGIKLIKTNQND